MSQYLKEISEVVLLNGWCYFWVRGCALLHVWME